MKFTRKLLIAILLTSNICFAQDWIITEITDFASIKFPGETELTETPIENVYTSQDEYAYYIVGVRNLNAQQSSQVPRQEIPNLYRGVVQGTMDAANGTVVEMNDIIVHEIPALELEYKVVANSNLPTHRFKRIVYVNQSIISIDFWPRSNQENFSTEKKAEFFNSFTINTNKIDKTSAKTNILKDANIEDDIAYNSGFEVGYFIGKVVFCIVLIALIVGLILLIKRISKKKKRETIRTTETQEITKPLIITCGNCDTENDYEAKYCNRCGYELKK